MRKILPILEEYMNRVKNRSNATFENRSIEELRALFNAQQKAMTATRPLYNITCQDLLADTAYGSTPLRLYLPETDTPLPVFIFFHGGGFVFGNLETLDSHCREIAHFTHSVVISVDYPLAPEYPFPAAIEACFAATCWIDANLHTYKAADLKRLFIGGSSAGATLATVVTHMIKERGGPKIDGQILLCPMTDSSSDTLSYIENGTGFNITRDQCIWFLSQYVQDPALYPHPYVAPLRATDWKPLPPALIIAAEFDPLRDEAEAYAKKLQDHHIFCRYLCYEGTIHGFSTMPLDFAEKSDVLEQISTFIKERS